MKKTKVSLKAYGKINIGLDVTGRRPDGYHLVRMIMQTVDVCDVVTVENAGTRPENTGKGKPGHISISCSKENVPSGEGNIAYRAAEKVMKLCNIGSDVKIDIEKNIPMAAGMAGGSTDAAAVIKGLNELFSLNLSAEKMDEIALSLGADVPFTLRHGTFLSEGIGEVLTELPGVPECSLLVVNPGFEVSTKEIYSALDREESLSHPDIDALISRIEAADLTGMAKAMGNILADVCEKMHPEITALREKMVQMGALGSMMTGSGPTVFGIFADAAEAEKAGAYFTENTNFTVILSKIA